MNGHPVRYYQPHSSQRYDVSVRVSGAHLQVENELVGVKSFALAQCRLSPQTGAAAQRSIFLPGGGKLEFTRHPLLEQLYESDAARISGLHRLASFLEHRWYMSLAALAGTVTVVLFLITSGIPVAANRVAASMPVEADAYIGQGTMQSLDQAVFQPSELSLQQQQALTQEFLRLLSSVRDSQRYELKFRKGGAIGPNAFALPSGIVVVTDELVNLAGNHREVTAVLAHEIGHVEHRHALRTLLQNSAGILLLSVLLGDVSSINFIISALPGVLLHTQYSRDFEREADDFALQLMRQHAIAPRHFAAIMEKLQAESGAENESTTFLSTHPPTRERIEKFEKAQKELNNR